MENFPELSPLTTGLKGRCPRCGRGPLFSSYLEVAPSCKACNLAYDFANCGDGAAWFVMMIGGTLAVCVSLFVEFRWQPAYWVHLLAALPFGVVLPIILLRPIKGALINQQYHTHSQ